MLNQPETSIPIKGITSSSDFEFEKNKTNW